MQDFEFEYQSDVPSVAAGIREEIESRLRELADGHADMTGAAVNVREDAHAETPVYRGRVVVYMKPKNVAGQETAGSPTAALKGALEAVERQVRERRARIRSATRGREAG